MMMDNEELLKKAIATGAVSLEHRGQSEVAELMKYDWRLSHLDDCSCPDGVFQVIFEIPVQKYESIRSKKDGLEEIISDVVNEASGSDCFCKFVVKLDQKWIDYEKWKTGVYPGDEVVNDFLKTVDIPSVKECWEKVLRRRGDDPSGALTSSSTLLESVLAHILDDFGKKDYENKDLGERYNMVKKDLGISPDLEFVDNKEVQDKIKGILGSCNNIVVGLGFLRNKLGDAHPGMKPAPRHAALAVSLAGAMAVFLLETLEYRKQDG